MTEILVIIVNYRTAELTERCLNAVAKERATGLNLSAIIVDGCSGDGSVSRLRSFLDRTEIGSWTELLPLSFNGGFGWANNQALLHFAERLPPYIYLLNPDTEVEPGAIAALAQVLQVRTNVAAVGSQLLEMNGSLSASAFRFPTVRNEFVRGAQTSALRSLLGLKPTTIEMSQGGPVDWVTGASVMLRRDALKQTGLFDDGFFLYFEEVELMHRLKHSGWQIWSEPHSRVRHVGGASTGVNVSHIRRAKPDYWFNSRLRYFVLTGGKRHALLANLAWLAGFVIIGFPRLLFSSVSRERAEPGELRGVVHAGFRPRGPVSRRSAPHISANPNNTPHWKNWA